MIVSINSYLFTQLQVRHADGYLSANDREHTKYHKQVNISIYRIKLILPQNLKD